MKTFKNTIYLLAGVAFLGISNTAMAAAVGFADLSNCSGGGVMVNATQINWATPGTQPNTGCFNTGTPTSISYSGGSVGAGATGNIKDLVAGGGTVDQFMTILGTSPLLDFVLTGFAAAATSSTACNSTVGNECIVAAGSPFLLTNTATGVSVTLDALGTITDGGVTNNWISIFSTQIAGTTDSAIQTTILGGGSISSTYSAALTVAPEPSTVSMLLLGGVALLGIGRLRFRKG